MKVRHVNNIVIELEEWETEVLRDFLRTELDKSYVGKGYSMSVDMLHNLLEELEKLITREA